MNEQTKTCSNCKKPLPATTEYFHRTKKTRSGLRAKCRECRSRRPGGFIPPARDGYIRCHACLEEYPATTDYFALDRSSKRGFQCKCKKCSREWRTENWDKVNETRRKFYASHPGIKTEYSKAYRKKHPGKSARDARRRYHKNPEKARADYRRRYAANREARIKSALRYAAANPDRVRATYHRRIARKQSLSDTLTVEDWNRALDYFGGCCAICRRPAGLWHTIAADHWIPLSSDDCPGSVPKNIIPLCHGQEGCNNSKGGKDPVEWLELKLGKRKAKQINQKIKEYFRWITNTQKQESN